MTVRRTTSFLVALLVLASLPVVAGATVAAAADIDVGRAYVPADRGGDTGAPDEEDEEKAKKAEKQEACPVDLWTIGLPVEGLACVLLFPKTEKEKEEPETDKKPGAPERRR